MSKTLRFSCDFETTVYEQQTTTEVWASAVVEIGTEDVKIFHSIDETFDYFKSLRCNIIAYYHNLKFDGNFWLSFLLLKRKYKQAVITENGKVVGFLETEQMKSGTFKYAISSQGQWYYIIIKIGQYTLEIRDSLKLLPFSVKSIGKSFNTKHKKLEMVYEGKRYAGCDITDEEKEYISNDVLVVSEALQTLFAEKHDKLTIGACCFSEFKKGYHKTIFDDFFPDLSAETLPANISNTPYRYKNMEDVDEYIRKSYRGGWCYVVNGKQGKLHRNGTTADVNSLYPSVMHSISGNKYPIGRPIFFTGNLPKNVTTDENYYFLRIRTRFYLKPNYLPFIQIKGNPNYPSNECLCTSDIYNNMTKEYNREYVDKDGQIKPAIVEMVVTQTDWELIQRHYDLEDLEIIDGCYFQAEIGLFDNYINKYRTIKMTSKGAKRQLAKLFLNNLYGKMSTSRISSFKVAYIKDDKSIGFYDVIEYGRKVGYIPIGSAITSYARYFTITTAQLNYHGINKRGFIYADTDSIHCDLQPSEIQGINVDENEFCCWKLESCWDIAYFVRQKTYIEHITHNDCVLVDNPYYDIKCAGMPEQCKKLFLQSMGEIEIDNNKLTDKEKEFISVKRNITDFTFGLTIPSKLMPKRIEGGVILKTTDYEMRY